MRVSRSFGLSLLVALVRAAEDEAPTSTAPAPACTASSATGSGAFYDLRPDIAIAVEDGKSHRGVVTKDYHSRGYDYGKNFTINICGSVIEPVGDVVGVAESLWANTSAYYTSEGKTYSIGAESMNLQSRGRKLVLQYSGGSPCGQSAKRRRDLLAREPLDSDEGYYAGEDAEEEHTRRKSATISFLCDRDPGTTQAAIAFVGTDPDECAYFFEARSVHACAQAEPHKPGSVGPGSIFGLILVIAVLVYLLGGVFYNRTITHARGWRQLPNYSLWAGIWSFICDMLVITLSSCSRFLPGRRGYSHLSSSPTGRHRNSEAENRLIDQLDEEWDD